MDGDAPAHPCCISREQVLEAGCLAVTSDLNPLKNLWDQLSYCVKAHNVTRSQRMNSTGH